MREALAKFNDVRIQFFAEQADLHYVMANNDDDKKEINVVKTKLVALQSKVRAAKHKSSGNGTSWENARCPGTSGSQRIGG